MKQSKFKSALPIIMLIVAMCIYGSIGLVRKSVALSSSLIALSRSVIGAIFLIVALLLRKQKVDINKIKKNFVYLVISALALGFNWVFLFESYSYLSVATATLIYYFAPTIVIFVSVPLFKDKLTLKHILCAIISLVGMIFISGVLQSEFTLSISGILFAVGAMLLYATVIVLNRKANEVPTLERTTIQLSVSAIILLPYTLLTDKILFLGVDSTSIILLLVMGIVHTGIAYLLYFSAIGALKSHTVAIFSYIDPTLAVILSFTVIQEGFSVFSLIGAILIILSSIVSQVNLKTNKPKTL